jgi:ubiquinone/menaquinone biosynthesis C-methylase UbiE
MTPQEVAAIFDARAERYIGDDWHRRYAEQLVTVAPLRPGDRVLDAATGTGFAACAIAKRVGPSGHVLGVDVSRGMLQQAQRLVDAERLTNVELLEADATDLRALDASTFDAVVCAAGLLYMPVANALAAWRRLLKSNGVAAFSTMQAGSPSAGRIFRECASRFGLDLKDPSEALGTEDQCRAVFQDAGFHTIQVMAGRVDFEHLDPVLAWEANSRAHLVAPSLTPQKLDDLRHEYLGALEEARRETPGEALRADVLFAVARRP